MTISPNNVAVIRAQCPAIVAMPGLRGNRQVRRNETRTQAARVRHGNV